MCDNIQIRMVLDAFDMFDTINDTESGGIEAPRAFMTAEMTGDDSCKVTLVKLR